MFLGTWLSQIPSFLCTVVLGRMQRPACDVRLGIAYGSTDFSLRKWNGNGRMKKMVDGSTSEAEIVFFSYRVAPGRVIRQGAT